MPSRRIGAARVDGRTPPRWLRPPPDLRLADDEVHLWRIRVEEGDDRLPAIWETLSPDEKQRAGRFHHERDRRMFTLVRGALRAIVGHYARWDPISIRFVYDEGGKPRIEGDPIRFSVTHAGELALIAAAGRYELGVDLERIMPGMEIDEIAGCLFSRGERERLASLPPAERPEAFFQIWSGKEAFAKGTGQGLAIAMRDFEIDLSPGPGSGLRQCLWDGLLAERWVVCRVAIDRGYAAALAVEGHDWRLRQWQFPGQSVRRGRQ